MGFLKQDFYLWHFKLGILKVFFFLWFLSVGRETAGVAKKVAPCERGLRQQGEDLDDDYPNNRWSFIIWR